MSPRKPIGVRDILPGEVVTITGKEVQSKMLSAAESCAIVSLSIYILQDWTVPWTGVRVYDAKIRVAECLQNPILWRRIW